MTNYYEITAPVWWVLITFYNSNNYRNVIRERIRRRRRNRILFSHIGESANTKFPLEGSAHPHSAFSYCGGLNLRWGWVKPGHHTWSLCPISSLRTNSKQVRVCCVFPMGGKKGANVRFECIVDVQMEAAHKRDIVDGDMTPAERGVLNLWHHIGRGILKLQLEDILHCIVICILTAKMVSCQYPCIICGTNCGTKHTFSPYSNSVLFCRLLCYILICIVLFSFFPV